LDARSFSKLVQAAELRPGDTVLDIGCGTGYSAVVIGRLAGKVVALEEDEALAQSADRNIIMADARNVTFQRGSLKAGAPAQAPFDAIILEGMIEEVPTALIGQLKPEGRLLAFVAIGGRLGRAMCFVRAGEGLSGRALFDANVPALPGFAKKRAFVF
jgi:protein-L-isoaspartate(D-aspartate) O-methyltransferase